MRTSEGKIGNFPGMVMLFILLRLSDSDDEKASCPWTTRSSFPKLYYLIFPLSEMKNEELRKVRLQLSQVSNKDQELIEAKRSVQRLEQKIEDLTAMLSSKTDQERQLHQEKQQLRVSLDREAQVSGDEITGRHSSSICDDTLCR